MNYAKKNRHFYYDAQYRHWKQEKVRNKINAGKLQRDNYRVHSRGAFIIQPKSDDTII